MCIASYVSFVCGAVGVLFLILLFMMKPWMNYSLSVEYFLQIVSLCATVLAILFGIVTRKYQWGKRGLILGIMGLVVWEIVLITGELSLSKQSGESSIVGTTSKDAYGRVYEVRGGSRSMIDSDGNSSIFYVDEDVLRFEEYFLQLNGYQVAKLEEGIEKILIRKKREKLEIFVDGELLLTQSGSDLSQKMIDVTKAASLESESVFGPVVDALLVEFEVDSELPKLLDLDDSEAKLYPVLVENFSSEAEFTSWMVEKGIDCGVEQIRGRWGVLTTRENLLQIARIPALDWRALQPNEVPRYLTEPEFSLETKDENGPQGFRGYFLPEFRDEEPAFLAFRTAEGTEGVMAVTESTEVKGLQFQVRYSSK